MRSRLPCDRPQTLILPPMPYAAAIMGGWWLDRHVLPLKAAVVYGQILALGFLAAGLGLMLGTVWQLYRQRTTINPFSAASRLCVSGVFRWSRNPIYVGDWLILIAASLWLATLWPLLLSPLVWGIIRYGVIRHEEEHLEAKFGGQYRQYKAEVRRWL